MYATNRALFIFRAQTLGVVTAQNKREVKGRGHTQIHQHRKEKKKGRGR